MKPQQKWIGVGALIIFLTMISGLRVDTALYSDDWSYRNMFCRICESSFSELDIGSIEEPAFTLYTWLISRVSNDPQVFIFITSAITIVLFVRFIYKNSLDFTMSIFLFIAGGSFFTSMNIMRQYLAIGIVLQGYTFIKNKKLLPYVFIVLVAFLFHKSALFAIPCYFIMSQKSTNTNILLVYIVSIIVMTFSGPIIENLLSNSIFSEYTDDYLSDSSYGVGITRIAFYSLFEIPLIIKRERILKNNSESDREMFNSLAFSNAIIIISSLYVYIARIDYWKTCELILFPLFPQLFLEEDQKTIKKVMVVLFFAFGLYQTYNSTFHNILFTFV